MPAAIVGMLVFVMVNSFVCMDDLKADIDDINDDEAETNFERKFKTATWHLFNVVITLIFGAIAITKLLEVW